MKNCFISTLIFKKYISSSRSLKKIINPCLKDRGGIRAYETRTHKLVALERHSVLPIKLILLVCVFLSPSEGSPWQRKHHTHKTRRRSGGGKLPVSGYLLLFEREGSPPKFTGPRLFQPPKRPRNFSYSILYCCDFFNFL